VIERKGNVSKNTSAIIDLSKITDTKRPQETFGKWKQVLSSVRDEISPDGSMWIITRNGFEGEEIFPWPIMISDYLHDSCRLSLKNVLIHYIEPLSKDTSTLSQAYELILFFTKTQSYFFNKDPIREPHIFKDIEWGRRKTSASGYHQDRQSLRYPDRGRDPGNVFYRTKRDAAGQVLDVTAFSRLEILDKLIRISTEKQWTVITNIASDEFESTITSLERKMMRMEGPH
jgi:hypothetical protein